MLKNITPFWKIKIYFLYLRNQLRNQLNIVNELFQQNRSNGHQQSAKDVK